MTMQFIIGTVCLVLSIIAIRCMKVNRELIPPRVLRVWTWFDIAIFILGWGLVITSLIK